MSLQFFTAFPCPNVQTYLLNVESSRLRGGMTPYPEQIIHFIYKMYDSNPEQIICAASFTYTALINTITEIEVLEFQRY